jgi:hypothetical protein
VKLRKARETLATKPGVTVAIAVSVLETLGRLDAARLAGS